MEYIFKNILRIICTFLVSIFFVFLIFPVLINLEFVKNFLSGTVKEPFIAIMALVLFFTIYSWPEAQNLWQRYKNIYKLEKPPFIYLDYIVLFIIFSILLIVLFQTKSIPNLSLQFKVFISLNFIFIIGWFFSSYYWKKKKGTQKVSNIDIHSLSDEPIQFAAQDLLGREKFVGGLYKEITNFPFGDPFVFGLYGSWGEGKTSIINLLRDKFKENEDFLIVYFDPWHFKDEEAILAAFYNQVEHTISQRFVFPGLKKTFIKYRKLISLGLSQAGIKIDLSYPEESLEEIRQGIESYIIQTKKKIIIFIDDIDRLQPREVLLIFKLVRLNAKFQNTIFLLSFDPIVVQNYLKDNLNADSEFLEKIVQKPVPLPAIEQRDIDQLLDVHIDKLFNELAIPKENREKFEKDLPFIYQTQIRKLFKTLRHVKRYLNGLRSTLPPIKKEINLYDFFILEVIRVFYPKVFNDIWRNPWFYIPLHWSETTYFLSPFSFATKEDEKYSQIKEHVENIVKNEKEGEVLRELLELIFFVEVKNALGQGRTDHSGSVASYRVEKRITHPESFRKYFMLKVPPLEISDEFVETTLDLWHSAEKTEMESIIEKTTFELQKKEKLLEFFKKLMVFIDKIQRDIVPDIVKVIYKNAGKFSKKGTENLWNSEYDKARHLLMWLINDKIDKDKKQDVLEEVIIKSPYLPFSVRTVLSCREERRGPLHNIYDSIKIEEIQNKVADRLKKYFIVEKRDIFDELQKERDWGFVLYQWATNWMTFTGDNNKVVSSYVFSLLRDNVKKFIKFLMNQREKTASDTWTFNLDKFGQVYNLTEFQEIAKKFKDDNSLSRESKESIEMFLKLYDDKRIKEGKNQSLNITKNGQKK